MDLPVADRVLTSPGNRELGEPQGSDAGSSSKNGISRKGGIGSLDSNALHLQRIREPYQ